MNASRRDILKKLVGGVVGGAATLAFVKDTSAKTKAEPPQKVEDVAKNIRNM